MGFAENNSRSRGFRLSIGIGGARPQPSSRDSSLRRSGTLRSTRPETSLLGERITSHERREEFGEYDSTNGDWGVRRVARLACGRGLAQPLPARS